MTTLTTPKGRVMGPTWQRGPNGKFILPEHTIGWQVIDWCEEYLLQPDGPNAGEPWRFTNEQRRFLCHWYSIDARGRFLYRAGMLRRMKGWGKDPFVAAICCAEFLGPCRFKEWGADGEPIAEPHYAATVQIAAVSQDQVKRNTMSLFPQMLSARAISEFELDIGKEIIWGHRGRCRVEMLTSASRSAEGARPTFCCKNETQHWLASNGGDDMSDVCARNVAKSSDGSARTLAISNAHAPGEMSDAERDYEAAMLGDAGFMYDSIEASDETVEALRSLKYDVVAAAGEVRLRAQLVAELEWCRGDSVWLNIERLLDECLAPKTRINEALRFYFNRLAASEERAFKPERWAALKRTDYKPEPGALICCGFDGSRNDDWTALIAVEVATGFMWPVGIWVPMQDDYGEWNINGDEVEAAVAQTFETYDVWRMYCDPYLWQEQIRGWEGRYNKPGHDAVSEFDTARRMYLMAMATQAFMRAVDAAEISHDGDERMAMAIANSYRRELRITDDKGEPLVKIEKERAGSPLKIDPVVGGILAWMARLDAMESGAEVGNVEFWFVND